MNPTTDQLPPPPQQQPPRSSFSCDRHPNESFNGFCPLCLCERLTTLDNNTATTSTSRRNSTSSAIKSIFKNKLSVATATKTSSFFPELRRTKSFSASRNADLTTAFEPQRKSCDVRNSLFSLFSVENNHHHHHHHKQLTTTDIFINKEDQQQQQVDSEIRNIVDEIAEISEEIAEEEKSLQQQEEEEEEEEEKCEGDAEEEVVLQELKTMKDHIHIDLDSNSKKSTTRSNFWSAASVLSKKWQKWRRKQKKSPENDVVSSSTLPVKKPRETQSEIADYGFGRRSCDVDPRFSLDAGRVSFDDPRYSFDEPRASWDGYLIGRTFPRLPPMVEDVPVMVHVPPRPDTQQISVVVKNDEFVPGGSVQTREYYTDSSSKRRKSLDRSNSIRKMAAAVVAEMDQTKANTAASNAKVTPATIDYGYPNRGLRFPSIGGERELGRDSNSNSLRDDCSETFELGLNGGEKKELGKKPRRWRWKLWGFIQRRASNKDDDDDDGFSRVERSYSESWQESGINKKVFRSNSSVSWRKKSTSEINGKNRRVGGDEFVLERNRSARYSPKHTDSGLLRFYLTPLRGSRTSSRSTSNSNSVGKNMLRPY